MWVFLRPILPIEDVPLNYCPSDFTILSFRGRRNDHYVVASYHNGSQRTRFPLFYNLLRILEQKIHVLIKTLQIPSDYLAALELDEDNLSHTLIEHSHGHVLRQNKSLPDLLEQSLFCSSLIKRYLVGTRLRWPNLQDAHLQLV